MFVLVSECPKSSPNSSSAARFLAIGGCVVNIRKSAKLEKEIERSRGNISSTCGFHVQALWYCDTDKNSELDSEFPGLENPQLDSLGNCLTAGSAWN